MQREQRESGTLLLGLAMPKGVACVPKASSAVARVAIASDDGEVQSVHSVLRILLWY